MYNRKHQLSIRHAHKNDTEVLIYNFGQTMNYGYATISRNAPTNPKENRFWYQIFAYKKC